VLSNKWKRNDEQQGKCIIEKPQVKQSVDQSIPEKIQEKIQDVHVLVGNVVRSGNRSMNGKLDSDSQLSLEEEETAQEATHNHVHVLSSAWKHAPQLGLDTLRTLKSPIPKCLHDLPSLP
jgi:hypothetical protein